MDASKGALGVLIHHSRSETRLLLNIDAGSDEVSFDHVRFRGQLLVVRRYRDGALEIRALGLRYMISSTLGIELKSDRAVDFEVHVRDGRESWPRGPCEGLRIAFLESDGASQ